jgi:hypothetical protein
VACLLLLACYQGNWIGKYGTAGTLFFALAPPPSPTPIDPRSRCAVVGEAAPNTTNMRPLVCPGSHMIGRVVFAVFGVITGDCQHGLGAGSTCALNLTRQVSAVCVGHHSCALSCVQGGAHRCTVNGQPIIPSPDPCVGVGKHVGLQVECAAATMNRNSGLGAQLAAGTTSPRRPGCDPDRSYCNASLPIWVTSVTNAYQRGRLSTFRGVNLTDPRALENPSGGGGHGTHGSRTIGALADTVIIAIDIEVDTPHRRYQLAAYFVDWEDQGRVSSVSLLNATVRCISTDACQPETSHTEC